MIDHCSDGLSVKQAAIRREHEILKAVQSVTGERYVHLEGIPTRDARVATQVLPLLADFYEQESSPIVRGAIVHCFNCPHMRPYFERVVQWWKSESDRFASSLLTQILMELAERSNAGFLWKSWKDLERKPADSYGLVAKLVRLDPGNTEARGALVKALWDGVLSEMEIAQAAKVRDPRVVAWFGQHLNAERVWLRALSRRVVRTSKRLPTGVRLSLQGPESRPVLTSFEVGIEELSGVLGQIRERFGVTVPTSVKNGEFLAAVDENSWVQVDVKQRRNAYGRELWMRLEDIDTVEVVLTGLETGSPVEGAA